MYKNPATKSKRTDLFTQAEDFAAKALQETKNYAALATLIAFISCNIYAIITNITALNSIPVNPWILNGDMYILDPAKTICIGPISQCLAQTGVAMLGTTQILSPVQIFTNWIIDQTPAGLRLSYINTSNNPTQYLAAIEPLIHFTNNGGVVVGPSADLAVPNSTTLVGYPVNYLINNTWLSSSSTTFVGTGTQYIDSVCHVLNASICGTLFRNSLADIGIFRSIDHTIIGLVDYGAIVASLNAGVIFNRSMVVVDYTDAGSALPCIQNPVGLPPESNNLWVDMYTGSCTIYSDRNSSIIPTNTCFNLATIPGLSSIIPTATPLMFASIYYQNLQVNINIFSDNKCSTYLTTQTTSISLGCNALNLPNPSSSFYFRLQN